MKLIAGILLAAIVGFGAIRFYAEYEGQPTERELNQVLSEARNRGWLAHKANAFEETPFDEYLKENPALALVLESEEPMPGLPALIIGHPEAANRALASQTIGKVSPKTLSLIVRLHLETALLQSASGELDHIWRSLRSAQGIADKLSFGQSNESFRYWCSAKTAIHETAFHILNHHLDNPEHINAVGIWMLSATNEPNIRNAFQSIIERELATIEEPGRKEKIETINMWIESFSEDMTNPEILSSIEELELVDSDELSPIARDYFRAFQSKHIVQAAVHVLVALDEKGELPHSLPIDQHWAYDPATGKPLTFITGENQFSIAVPENSVLVDSFSRNPNHSYGVILRWD